ncbi:MAG: cysteine--tRNA ligase, partial [Hyphomicrobium sp.]
MAKTWMHNGFLQVEGEKMSKSLGNFITINELLETKKLGGRMWPGEVLRLAMLMTHYREPIDFTIKRLEEAQATIGRWSDIAFGTNTGAFEPKIPEGNSLLDDMNTPKFITEMHGLYKDAKAGDSAARINFRLGLQLLGFDEIEMAAATRALANAQLYDDPEIRALITARLAARRAKDFKESDRIRDELAGMGITLKDTKNKATGEIETTWEVAR